MNSDNGAFTSPRDSRTRGQKLGERVAREIVDVIVSNQMTSGTRLPIESVLQEQLGVGKNTLREALRILEAWGVVEIRRGRNGGPTVRNPRPEDLREALTVQLLFASATLDDVIEARCCVEPQSAMLAAERMTNKEMSKLRDSVQRMRDQADDQAAFLEENQFFHWQIAASTGNVVMQAFLDTLKSVLDGTSRGVQYKPARRLAVADAHECIVEAIAARDPHRARREMEAHLREAGRFWQKSGELSGRPVPWGF
ncbi:FadR/GntR family transcriptional regulator [Actinomadura alba]|uniref:FadR family transcriptional regulator n=1 Tax=Actinomadura alba TaxID=406431 RepID=A0ABR7LTS3_9ACTN|nr:FadR/GntR family transcriptional regulator [Actinomadura alba]MBC6468078.1 FadR family transcriptional regulator [Actinomadura alba]